MVSWFECQYIKGRYTGYPCVLKHTGLTPDSLYRERFTRPYVQPPRILSLSDSFITCIVIFAKKKTHF
jgi:hypothetical protein